MWYSHTIPRRKVRGATLKIPGILLSPVRPTPKTLPPPGEEDVILGILSVQRSLIHPTLRILLRMVAGVISLYLHPQRSHGRHSLIIKQVVTVVGVTGILLPLMLLSPTVLSMEIQRKKVVPPSSLVPGTPKSPMSPMLTTPLQMRVAGAIFRPPIMLNSSISVQARAPGTTSLQRLAQPVSVSQTLRSGMG